jgi:hypothetical protein
LKAAGQLPGRLLDVLYEGTKTHKNYFVSLHGFSTDRFVPHFPQLNLQNSLL